MGEGRNVRGQEQTAVWHSRKRLDGAPNFGGALDESRQEFDPE